MAKTRKWTGTSNQFERATRSSFIKAIRLTSFTNAALSGPNGIPALFSYFNAIHIALLLAYDAWLNQLAQQKGATASLTDLFSGLTPSVREWDIRIQMVYPKGTPDYIKLMPYGRAPFTRGPQELRIRALNVLSMAIGTDTSLAIVKSGVDNYYNDITTLNTQQKNMKTLTDSLSTALEAARISACQGLQYVQNGLCQHFIADPSQVDQYFLLTLVQNPSQKVYTGTTKPLQTEAIAKRTLKATNIVDVTNKGEVPLEFYLAAWKGGPVPEGTMTLPVPAHESRSVPVTQLGNISNKFLTVYNPSDLADGEWEMDL